MEMNGTTTAFGTNDKKSDLTKITERKKSNTASPMVTDSVTKITERKKKCFLAWMLRFIPPPHFLRSASPLLRTTYGTSNCV
jgi:hypothetical protein